MLIYSRPRPEKGRKEGSCSEFSEINARAHAHFTQRVNLSAPMSLLSLPRTCRVRYVGKIRHFMSYGFGECFGSRQNTLVAHFPVLSPIIIVVLKQESYETYIKSVLDWHGAYRHGDGRHFTTYMRTRSRKFFVYALRASQIRTCSDYCAVSRGKE